MSDETKRCVWVVYARARERLHVWAKGEAEAIRCAQGATGDYNRGDPAGWEAIPLRIDDDEPTVLGGWTW